MNQNMWTIIIIKIFIHNHRTTEQNPTQLFLQPLCSSVDMPIPDHTTHARAIIYLCDILYQSGREHDNVNYYGLKKLSMGTFLYSK